MKRGEVERVYTWNRYRYDLEATQWQINGSEMKADPTDYRDLTVNHLKILLKSITNNKPIPRKRKGTKYKQPYNNEKKNTNNTRTQRIGKHSRILSHPKRPYQTQNTTQRRQQLKRNNINARKIAVNATE